MSDMHSIYKECIDDLTEENKRMARFIKQLRAENDRLKANNEYWVKHFNELRSQFDEMQQRAEKAERERDELLHAVYQWQDCDTASQSKRAQLKMYAVVNKLRTELYKGNK